MNEVSKSLVEVASFITVCLSYRFDGEDTERNHHTSTRKDRKRPWTVLSTYEDVGQPTAPVSIYDEEFDLSIDIINFHHRESLFSTFWHKLEQASAIGVTSSGSSVKTP
mmetsp:Transcript_12904/g.31385  ORF Transcript_12904/g.31385 Transcript_12904/m.31385 type:complete len:109 (-) Transcript_12904:3196-3522(-)